MPTSDAERWTATIYRDGEPVVTAPVDIWLAAQVLAEVTVALFGGPVSVANAVIECRRLEEAPGEPSLFDEMESLS